MVLPSSAPLNCTEINLTSFLPHSEHGTCATEVFSISLLSTVCTKDRFCLSSEGKSAAFVLVMLVVKAVSRNNQYLHSTRKKSRKPLFSFPQHSQIRIALSFPVELSSRLPQSVQKTREPMADILDELLVLSRKLERSVKIILRLEPCNFEMQPLTVAYWGFLREASTTQRRGNS